ncbi:PH domain-containing protein [Flavobacterium sp. HXWNR69]|uniref:PH domain-containing protein n=1 Tax=Flavobacterium fragile TaxID=2949085 RepID=A0ABT0TG29_9FLAO|nr:MULTISPECIES: PH domain-containing protein [unclassified Flavobacterium]MCL9769926.1 PH domain-containing protein [Flavobacterium sp. HXWNR69]
MIFKSAVSKLNKYIYVGVILFLLLLTIPALFEDSYEPLVVLFTMHFLIILFFLWLFTSTYYRIENSDLHWKSGPFYGKIDITKISKIEYHKGIYVPTIWKPALSHIGLIITYNKYDDIYISPEKQEEFIATLQRLNPNITFKNTPYVE